MPVHLEDVAGGAVDHEPADRPARVVAQAADLVRVGVLLDQLLEGELDRELLQLVLVVQGERVVHVEPDHLDAVHPQVAVAEHAVLAGYIDVRGRLTEQCTKLWIEVDAGADHSPIIVA